MKKTTLLILSVMSLALTGCQPSDNTGNTSANTNDNHSQMTNNMGTNSTMGTNRDNTGK